MSTYDYEKVLSDYDNGRMDVEMAMGHALQHIGKLYSAQNTSQRELRDQVNSLATEVKTLRAELNQGQPRPAPDRLQKVEAHVTVLNQATTNLRADVDSLITHTGLPPRLQGKQRPPKAR